MMNCLRAKAACKLLTALLLILIAFVSGAQSSKPLAPFSIGIIDTIRSEVLGEQRVLNIYLPQGYKQNDTARYPVIYLLDGSANEDFIHIVGVVQFLTMIEAMPKTIVVGIANVDRKRDFTHPTTMVKHKKILPSSGGSAKFIGFITYELEPYVQNTYRVNGQKTIIGQSLGGLLATEVLLKEPELFDNYIIVSPSLWWNGESLLNSADSLLNATHAYKPLHVCVAVGNEGKEMEDAAKKLTDVLKATKTMKLYITYMPMPKETHLTILHRAVYNALESLYEKK